MWHWSNRSVQQHGHLTTLGKNTWYAPVGFDSSRSNFTCITCAPWGTIFKASIPRWLLELVKPRLWVEHRMGQIISSSQDAPSNPAHKYKPFNTITFAWTIIWALVQSNLCRVQLVASAKHHLSFPSSWTKIIARSCPTTIITRIRSITLTLSHNAPAMPAAPVWTLVKNTAVFASVTSITNARPINTLTMIRAITWA